MRRGEHVVSVIFPAKDYSKALALKLERNAIIVKKMKWGEIHFEVIFIPLDKSPYADYQLPGTQI